MYAINRIVYGLTKYSARSLPGLILSHKITLFSWRNVDSRSILSSRYIVWSSILCPLDSEVSIRRIMHIPRTEREFDVSFLSQTRPTSCDSRPHTHARTYATKSVNSFSYSKRINSPLGVARNRRGRSPFSETSTRRIRSHENGRASSQA